MEKRGLRLLVAPLIIVFTLGVACASAGTTSSATAGTEPSPDPAVPPPTPSPLPSPTAVFQSDQPVQPGGSGNPAIEAPGMISYGNDRSHFGVLSIPETAPPPDGHPVVILVHGGFWSEPWDYTLMKPLADDLVARGYATWNVEFRRLGGGGGWPETFDDVGAAIDRLADAGDHLDLDLDRTVLIGHSSGGHLALWALDRPDRSIDSVAAIGLGAVVDLTAFQQAERLLGGSVDALPERYAAAAPALDPSRVALVHGEDDRIVPRTTLGAAEENGVPTIVVADTDHFDVITPSTPSWKATLELAAEFLAG